MTTTITCPPLTIDSEARQPSNRDSVPIHKRIRGIRGVLTDLVRYRATPSERALDQLRMPDRFRRF